MMPDIDAPKRFSAFLDYVEGSAEIKAQSRNVRLKAAIRSFCRMVATRDPGQCRYRHTSPVHPCTKRTDKRPGPLSNATGDRRHARCS